MALPKSMFAWRFTSAQPSIEANLAFTASTPLPPYNPQPARCPSRKHNTLVKVLRVSLNPQDYKVPEIPIAGRFIVRAPATPCCDFVGRVVATTRAVDQGGSETGNPSEPPSLAFSPGDLVVGRLAFPRRHGTLAEYAIVQDGDPCVKVDVESMMQARQVARTVADGDVSADVNDELDAMLDTLASLGVAGLTALQSYRSTCARLDREAAAAKGKEVAKPATAVTDATGTVRLPEEEERQGQEEETDGRGSGQHEQSQQDNEQQQQQQQLPRVLIHGASGGCGVFGIQIGRLLGFEVVATGSGRNESLCRSLGASDFVDYTTTPNMGAAFRDLVAGKPDAVSNSSSITGRGARPFDLVVDNVGLDPSLYFGARDFLVEGGSYVVVGVGASARGMSNVLRMMIWNAAGRLASLVGLGGNTFRRLELMMVKPDETDLAQLASWVVEGRIRAVVTRFALDKAKEAFEVLRGTRGHKGPGKIVVEVSKD